MNGRLRVVDAVTRSLILHIGQHAHLGRATQVLIDELADHLAHRRGAGWIVPHDKSVFTGNDVRVADEDDVLLMARLDDRAHRTGIARQHDNGGHTLRDPFMQLRYLLLDAVSRIAREDAPASLLGLLHDDAHKPRVEVGSTVRLPDSKHLLSSARRHRVQLVEHSRHG